MPARRAPRARAVSLPSPCHAPCSLRLRIQHDSEASRRRTVSSGHCVWKLRDTRRAPLNPRPRNACVPHVMCFGATTTAHHRSSDRHWHTDATPPSCSSCRAAVPSACGPHCAAADATTPIAAFIRIRFAIASTLAPPSLLHPPPHTTLPRTPAHQIPDTSNSSSLRHLFAQPPPFRLHRNPRSSESGNFH